MPFDLNSPVALIEALKLSGSTLIQLLFKRSQTLPKVNTTSNQIENIFLKNNFCGQYFHAAWPYFNKKTHLNLIELNVYFIEIVLESLFKKNSLNLS
jgi:hypothetical protein